MPLHLLALACVVSLFAPAARADAVPRNNLPYPVYVSCRMSAPIVVDATLDEAAWRATSLGWGLSHAREPNLPCPDPTLFRIGWTDEALCLAFAAYRRTDLEPVPEHLWLPRETDMMDIQATPRHARERGALPPTNEAQLILTQAGRSVTFLLRPPGTCSVSVHDELGERRLRPGASVAIRGATSDALWTAEIQVAWEELGLTPPRAGEDWPLQVYRDLRRFSNWAYIAWMRDWGKAEYSRYDQTDRFGRILFVDRPEMERVEAFAAETVKRRGPVRVFLPDRLLLADADGPPVHQRYAERLVDLEAYAASLFRDRQRIGNDLPLFPFYPERERRPHLAPATQQLKRLRTAVDRPAAWDDPASRVALITHALPEARQGLAAWRLERLYRGLPD